MQTIFRIINLVAGPLLTLVLAAQFAGYTIAGKEAGDAIGGGLAGTFMLVVELALTQGPHRKLHAGLLARHRLLAGFHFRDLAGPPAPCARSPGG